MSFSAKVKDELAHVYPERRCCRLAELAALVRMDGTVSIGGQAHLGLSIVNENAAVSRKIFSYLKEMFPELSMEIRVRRKTRLRKNNVYMMRIPPQEGVKRLLRETGIMGEDLRLDYRINSSFLKHPCCQRAYLRGAFLGSGSITNPGKMYHLELISSNEEFSRELCDLVNRFRLKGKVSSRKNEYVVYLKGSEQIAEFLSLIGAHGALLEFENIRIIKGMKNQVNRIVNCETANLNKTVNAAVRQIENINIIEERMGLHKLPKDLQEVAELRLQYPEMSLKELGTNLHPAVGKSGVNHRMRRIEEIAERLYKGYSWNKDEE